MPRIRISYLLALIAGCITLFSVYCTQTDQQEVSGEYYLNHSDSAFYVGKEQCRSCHPSIYETFVKTGMGQSFGPATRQKSAASFHTKPVFDKFRNFYYYPFWQSDSLYVMEFRMVGRDTVYKRVERIDYIIGSGQHTNSHFTSVNGFIYQVPLTWYSQKGKWDLPPGFEEGRNVRFNRAIEFECMSCHNAMPQLESGAVNRFAKIPDGIDCERCHGPGSVHIKDKLAGNWVDTSVTTDRTIVNPGKLPWELQFDVCQRCHLQGNAILKPGKKFEDFRPGMKLGDFMEVYMPLYKGRDDEFIMASHAQRLQQSKCFINSTQSSNSNSIKLTCITCHNPHVSVKVTGKQIFNNACAKCHTETACREKKEVRVSQENNCVSCHMPSSGSIDIPHVSVHDHKIKIPVSKQTIQSIKEFAGIYCVNTKSDNPGMKSMAYLNYAEKFEGEKVSVDSAFTYLELLMKGQLKFEIKVHYLYLKEDWSTLALLSQGKEKEMTADAWTNYRIGQAFQNLGEFESAYPYFERAVKELPLNLEFINKQGVLLIQMQRFDEARQVLEHSASLQPKQEQTWINLGFAMLNLKQFDEALACYNRALKLNPDQLQALMNRAALFNLTGKKKEAMDDLKQILKLEPGNTGVKNLLMNLTNG